MFFFFLVQVGLALGVALAAPALRRGRHPADGRQPIARYDVLPSGRTARRALIGACLLAGVGVGWLVFSRGDVVGRLLLLDVLVIDALLMEAIRANLRKAYVVVDAEGIYRPDMTIRWTEVEEAWFDEFGLVVRFPAKVKRNWPLELTAIDTGRYRFTAADYVMLRSALPAHAQARLDAELRLGRHAYVPPKGLPRYGNLV
jgi:hypothetical protein